MEKQTNDYLTALAKEDYAAELVGIDEAKDADNYLELVSAMALAISPLVSEEIGGRMRSAYRDFVFDPLWESGMLALYTDGYEARFLHTHRYEECEDDPCDEMASELEGQIGDGITKRFCYLYMEPDDAEVLREEIEDWGRLEWRYAALTMLVIAQHPYNGPEKIGNRWITYSEDLERCVEAACFVHKNILQASA